MDFIFTLDIDKKESVCVFICLLCVCEREIVSACVSYKRNKSAAVTFMFVVCDVHILSTRGQAIPLSLLLELNALLRLRGPGKQVR